MTNGYDRYCIKQYSVFHDGIYDTEIGFSFQNGSSMRAVENWLSTKQMAYA